MEWRKVLAIFLSCGPCELQARWDLLMQQWHECCRSRDFRMLLVQVSILEVVEQMSKERASSMNAVSLGPQNNGSQA